MKPTLTLFDPQRQLKNFTVTDTVDLNNPMKISGLKQTQDVIVIDNFNRPMCTKRILLDVCVISEAVEAISVQIDLEKTICYVDQDKYGSNNQIQSNAVECANTEYLTCK